ncbi:hypothetical protein SFA33_23095 [Escherichia coli]|nr:hypothetical protein [Escherichia coli]
MLTPPAVLSASPHVVHPTWHKSFLLFQSFTQILRILRQRLPVKILTDIPCLILRLKVRIFLAVAVTNLLQLPHPFTDPLTLPVPQQLCVI